MSKKRTKAGTSKAAAAARRATFAHAYIGNGRNATEAAITAGFSRRSAHTRGLELVKDRDTSALIGKLTAAHALASGLTVERTLREVARLAFSDIGAAIRPDGTMIPLHEMTPDMRAAIASVEVDSFNDGTETGKDGETKPRIGHTTKLKIWDKNAALEKAFKHLGLFEKDNAQSREHLTLTVEAAKPVKR